MILDQNIRNEIEDLERELQDIEFSTDKNTIIKELSALLIESIKKRVKGKVGIAFSGGLDSSLLALLCSRLELNFKLYCVGLQNSSDTESASNVAFQMNWPLKLKLFNLNEAETIISNVVNILDSTDSIRVGIACPLYSVLEMATKDKIKEVLTGLGSEEIFAGYERHRIAFNNDRLNEECWNGLKLLWERDISRDSLILNYFGIKPLCPFLDKELVKYAMQIDPKLKIDHENKKIILRETAIALGLKKEFALRPKKAAQYGSGFDKAIEKLAKKNGFKNKKEYLESLIS